MYIASLPLYQEGNYVGDGELQLSRHPRKTRYNQVTHKQASITPALHKTNCFFFLFVQKLNFSVLFLTFDT